MTGHSKRPKPITLEDIAKLAGVHSRTVADALKGTGRVAPSTRENVLRIAQELNYVPNAAARTLATGRTGRIAVLSGPLNTMYYANMVHLLESHLTANGYDTVLLHHRRQVADLENATKASLVDGVIVTEMNRITEAFLRAVSPVQPCVLIDTSQPDFVDHIALDLRPAVQEALHLMLSAKRCRIAYIVNDVDDAAHSEVRMETYLGSMRQVNRQPETIATDTALTPQERIQQLRQYLETHGCPDAILCQNDETAIYTYQAITSLGYRVPEDALLCGCDGLPYTEYLATPLSTIALPLQEICTTASQFLQSRIANPNLARQQKTLPGRLIVRQSLLTSLTKP